MAMDKKPESKGMPFRIPRDEEVSRPLLDPQDLEEQPAFKLTFSTILLLRVPIIPIAITDSVFMGHCRHHVGAGFFFELFPVGLCLWTLVNFLGKFGVRRDKFEIGFGDYVCFCGKRGKADRGDFPKRLARPYLTIVGDFFFCVLFIIISVVSKKDDIWDWRWENHVFGLSLTLCILQLIISFLNFFSILRRAKIVVYPAEYDEKVNYAIPDREIYLDEGSEARVSTSSLV